MSRNICRPYADVTASPPSVIELNNNSLSYFLLGDYETAIEGLRMAFNECMQRQQNLLMQGNLMSSVPCKTASSLSPSKADKGCECTDISMAIDEDNACSEDSDESSGGGYDVIGDTSMNGDEVYRTDSSQPLDSNVYPPCSLSQPSLQATMIQRSALPFHNVNTTVNTPTAYTMYNRAFVLAPTDGQDSMMIRTSAIILYNLALVYHNQGIYKGMSSALWDALKLYEQALETLDKHVPTGGRRQHGGLDHLRSGGDENILPLCWRIMDIEKILLAILNNMGNIHAHLFHAENTRACMRSLQTVLEASATTASLLATTNRNEDQVAATIATTINEDYTFFLLNAMFQENELAMAPAA